MKRFLCLLLAMVCFAALTQTALASGVTTVIQDEADRKIDVKGLGSDGNFPVNPEVPGQSPTTGLPWEGTYMPMLVQIDNADAGIGARAPWGASLADIIYETPLHKGGETRLSFLFSDVIPESVGPVRSARITHVELREEWDAGFLFYGGQPYEGTNIDDAFRKTGATKKGVLFSGLVSTGKPWKKYYTRVKGLPGPHDVDANVKAMQALIPADFKAPSRPYLFTDELPELGDFATNISITLLKPEYSSTFTYDPNANVYLRYMNGEPYVDKTTGEQISFSNLIIQRTEVTFYHGISDRPLTVNIGSGNADIFIGGRYIPGYWMRTGMNQRTVFFDQEGTELELQRGKTFISMIDYSTPVTYTAE
jgi:hypothetical protein